MESNGLDSRIILSLQAIELRRKPVGLSLVNRGTRENEVTVNGIVRVAGLIQIEEIQRRLLTDEKQKGA
jgi:hypothetical protein